MNEQRVSTGFDFKFITDRVKEILLTPDLAWDKIKAENDSVGDIYKKYLLVLAAIGPIFAWIKFSIIGISVLGYTYRAPIVGGLIGAIVQYGVQLLMAYLAAIILEKLAPKFEGSTTLNDTFRLVAYAATPAYISGVFIIIPAIGFIAALAGFIYSVYLFFKGLPKFVAISETKKFAYIAVSVVCIFFTGFILNLMAATVQPNHDIGTVHSGNGQLDLNELELKAKELQNMFKKP